MTELQQTNCAHRRVKLDWDTWRCLDCHAVVSGPQSADSSDDPVVVHPLIQTARGMLTDEDYTGCEAVLARAVDRAKDLEEEHERLRAEIEGADRAREDAVRQGLELRTEVERLRASLLTVVEQIESCCSRSGLCIDADRVRAEAQRSMDRS